jgi:hypothetical protein
MKLTDRPRVVATVAAAVGALAPALLISVIPSKVDREELAVAAAEEESTNLGLRLPTAAILLAAAAARVADLLMAPLPRAELISEISAEELEGLAPILSERASGAAAVAAGAVLGALSLSIAI